MTEACFAFQEPLQDVCLDLQHHVIAALHFANHQYIFDGGKGKIMVYGML